MDEVKEKGEGSSNWSTPRIGSCRQDGSNKKVKVREEAIFVGHIGEDFWNIIFCKLPLPTLFQLQVVCTSWQTIISSSVHFHNLWDKSNMQMWLMMDLSDETRESSNGLALFDVSRRLWYKKMFNDDWSCNNSKWFLRAGDGGLLVYTCREKGTLRVINPLTMQSRCLEDPVLTRNCRISFYMKKYHDDVAVHLKFDPEVKTYQVMIILANLYHLRKKNFVILIYKSAERRWEFREIDMGMTIMFSPRILMQNQKLYLFSEDGQNVGIYNLNGNNNTKFLYISGMQRVNHQTLGIVMCKGRIIMICKGKPMELQPHTHTLNFYEFDELGLQWRPKYEAVVSPKYLTHAICVGGDYIWVTDENEGYVEYIICIDIDTGELNIWPAGWEYNGRDCVSTRLSFRPFS